MMKMRFYIGGAPSFRMDLDAVPFDPVGAWGRFVAEYTTQFVPIKQHINQIINDPDATETEKANARQDLTIQGRCLQIVNDKYEEIQQTGVVPTSWTIDAQTAGSALYRWSDNNIYPVSINYPIAESEITSRITFATSQHFNVGLTFNRYPSGQEHYKMVSHEISMPPSGVSSAWYGIKAKGGQPGDWGWTFGYIATDTMGNLTSTSDSKTYGPPNAMIQLSGDTIPNIYPGRSCGIGADVTLPIGGYYISVLLPGATVDDPWDYYNNYILPQITTATNAVFPNGYTP